MSKEYKVGDKSNDGMEVWESYGVKDSKNLPYLVVAENDWGAVLYCQTHGCKFSDTGLCDQCHKEKMQALDRAWKEEDPDLRGL